MIEEQKDDKQQIDYTYDVALSYASENREYVEEVATFLKEFGVRVFYDKFETVETWGKNLYDHLNDVYKNKAKYTMIFVSEAYAEKAWTNHERKAAQARAINESKEYILPARFDDIEVPGIDATVAHLDAKVFSAKDVAKSFLEKSGLGSNRRWWGNWEAGKNRNWFEQDLFITRVDEQGFDFELICIHGAHTGEVHGYATFITLNEAQCEINDYDDDEPCRLNFYKINETMQITEDSCSTYHGMRAYFDSNYELQKDVFVYYDEIVDDRVLSNIYVLIGRKYWGKFQRCFGDTHELDDLDGFDVNIITGGIAGLYTIQESIFMIDKDRNVWGAFINDEDNKVYYFASLLEWKRKLPKTVEEWRENFKDKEVIFIDNLVIKDNVYQDFDDEEFLLSQIEDLDIEK